jgi:hypothetical protein
MKTAVRKLLLNEGISPTLLLTFFATELRAGETGREFDQNGKEYGLAEMISGGGVNIFL